MGFFGGDTSPLSSMIHRAGDASDRYGANATTLNAALTPFALGEMNAQHSLNPNDINELLTYGGAGAGAAAGAAQSEATNLAARTGNATTLTKTLDEMARDREKQAAGISEGVAAQDITGAQKLRQEGANLAQGLYGTDVKGQLDAMGIGSQGAEKIASQPGVFGQIVGGLSGLAQGAGSMMTGMGAMGAKF